MEINLYNAKAQLSKIVQDLIDEKEDAIIITKNGKPVVEMKSIIKKNSKRIGAAKKEMAGFHISQEEFDSLVIEDFNEYL